MPIFDGGEVIGEIDIDGSDLDAFDETDARFFEEVAALLAPYRPRPQPRTYRIGDMSTGPMNPVLAGAGSLDRIKGYYWLETMPVDEPGARKLRVDFERIMKVPPPDNALLYVSSTATEQILRAISAAGTDQDAEKLAAALREMKPESRYFGPGGWRGKTQYGINQELAFPIGMGIIADGKNLERRDHDSLLSESPDGARSTRLHRRWEPQHFSKTRSLGSLATPRSHHRKVAADSSGSHPYADPAAVMAT